MVSRRHAVVRPSQSSAFGYNCWLLCDLNSANGTYVNGQRLQGCQQLLLGDRLTLGHDGAEFIFERQIKHQSTQLASCSVPDTAISASSQPILTPLHSEHSVSFSQLSPILSTGRDLNRKAYLIPGILTVVFVVLMFATVG